MRAIIVEQNGGPDVLKLAERAVPEPGAGQVQFQVAYAVVHPMDMHARSGAMKWGVPPLPFVIGYGSCGRVTKIGEGVDKSWLGKRITAGGQHGAYADYAVASISAIAEIPDALSWQQSFAMGSALTAWHMLHTVGRIREGEWQVAHSAAGPVGLMLTQIAKEIGCHSIGLVGGAKKLAWAKQFGADHLIDYIADKTWPKTVMQLTNNRGVDFIMDGNSGPDMPQEFSCLAPLGQVIVIGAMNGPAPDVNVSSLIAGSKGIRGFVVSHGVAATQGPERDAVAEKIAAGLWAFPVSAPFTLESASAAHRAFMAREAMGRILLNVGGDI
ncbi:MAG: zinc-binding dehydrogenase [Rhodospirillaceae bacterium]|nr:zinc-binding dehydrogenase [Rhodospirillaceae bacterium]